MKRSNPDVLSVVVQCKRSFHPEPECISKDPVSMKLTTKTSNVKPLYIDVNLKSAEGVEPSIL